MTRKHQLSLPRIALSIAIGWLLIIMGAATTIIVWRLTLAPAMVIADLIVPAQESQE